MLLTLGFSPCPNDTFIFDALVHGRIDTEGLSFDVQLGDVEELNRRAFAGELAVTKLSYHAFGYLTQTYALLNAGSALGRGVGPLLVTAGANLVGPQVVPELVERGQGADQENASTLQLPNSRTPPIAIPGKYTTANYLLGLAYPELTNKTEVLFSDIETRVLSGEFAAGLLIHENRFSPTTSGAFTRLRTWERTGRPALVTPSP